MGLWYDSDINVDNLKYSLKNRPKGACWNQDEHAGYCLWLKRKGNQHYSEVWCGLFGYQLSDETQQQPCSDHDFIKKIIEVL